jgi:outer membrane receptor protein involved in Fe transport
MTRTLRYLIVLLVSICAFRASGQTAAGEITGGVEDAKSKEPLPGVVIQVSQGGIPKGGTVSDIDGHFSIKPIDPGTYDVTASYVGYNQTKITSVVVTADKKTGLKFDLEIATSKTTLGPVNVVGYRVPLVDSFSPGANNTYGHDQIEKLPTHSVATVVSYSGGVYDGLGGLQIHGGRSDGNQVIVDGVQVNGSNYDVPANAIDQIEVLPSGLSAKYGNLTGGVINIVTKGPSPKLHFGVMGEHSLDGYNNNLFNFNITGPLYSRKIDSLHKQPVIGFFLGGEFYYNKDAGPSYTGYYVAKDSVLNALRQNPLKIVQDASGNPVYKYATEFVTADQLDHTKANPNALDKDVNLNGKLDFRLPNNLSLTAGGMFHYQKAQSYSRSFSLFAPEATPEYTNNTLRGWIRFTQKFGNGRIDSGKRSVISNAFYSLQADYQLDQRSQEDPRFGHNIFDYLYLGKFSQNNVNVILPGVDSVSGRQGVINFGSFPSYVSFTRSDLNPNLANYTSEYINTTGIPPQTYDVIRNNRALINGDEPQSTYGLWANVATALSGYSVSRSDQFSLSVDASFDLLTGKTKHAIEFGLYYQQRVERGYTLLANRNGGTQSLWELMRGLTNKHISLDKNNPVFIVNGKRYSYNDVQNGLVNPGPSDTITYNYISNSAIQSTFDRNLRKKLGLNPDGTDQINIDGLDPSTFSIGMFSPDEILNSGNPYAIYQGYSYTGQLQTGQVNFNDFFTQKDANGNYTRPIGAFRPNYTAGYILDQFQINRILFNVGLRFERYDAANKVLTDPYSLYAEKTVSEFGGSHPSNIGGNYVVYVDDNTSSKPNVIGYRNGDNWYDPNGNFVEDPKVLKNYSGGRDPQPALQAGPNGQIVKITDSAFNPNGSFSDYTPQVNVLPRLSFSFPVSDVALFYGHYDIYTHNPNSGNVFTSPYTYYYLNQNENQVINNPALKPEKTFDYEMGFTQKLSNFSVITLTSFYTERKDMIQVRPYLYAWPITYFTYGNRDFSDTKGMTLKYELRRNGPLQMTINYTLQFLEGTGSGSNSANSGGTQVSNSGILSTFINSGLPNLRYVYPSAYDSRHNISVLMDYRYFKGEGPTIGDKHVFQNMGLSLVLTARSGEPYTLAATADPSNPQIVGQLNGARLPWHFGADLSIDKDFALSGISFRKRSPAPEGLADVRAAKEYSFNVYLYITNVLNIRDIRGVYGYTGSPSDNGYLTSSYGQQAIPVQTNPQSFVDLYSLAINSPGNLGLPRQVKLGIKFNF